ncbi:MAG: hypothetical protein DHS20C19_21210 [Acidimicrobiales bacterium]|nr:MAG: hypothetical protein DHS20C19_21210 [Acidimicrobiales bacterium]
MSAAGPVIEGEPVDLTFLFTDIEGSTGLWERHPAEMVAVIGRHDAILETAIADHKGVLIGKTGDGVVGGFASAHDALAAAVESQRALLTEPWGPIAELPVRMGIHSGPVFKRGDEYHGRGVNLSSRLHAAGHGGQILVSDVAAGLLADLVPAPLALTDLGMHRLRDFAEPIRIHQVGGPGLPAEFPRLRSKETGPAPLPAPPTRPIGRDSEIVQLGRLIGEHATVTVIGSPGVGKSRLAIDVANLRRDGYANGVRLCSLAGVGADDISVAIAAALDVEPRADVDIISAIVDATNNLEVLLVVDNCEHDTDVVAPLLDEIVARCRRITVLATRNSPIGTAGETVFRLEPLETGPDSHADQLFHHFAVAAGADEQTLRDPAITELCEKLDGLPMAIELAAAASVTQTPSEVLGSMRSVEAGDIPVVSLDETVSWSIDALPADHRRMLFAASVFVGGFTADAIAELIGADGRATVQPILVRLCDQSLIRTEHSANTTRFQILEPIRLHLRSRLDADQAEEMLDAHAALMKRLALAGGKAKRGKEEKLWARRLDADLDNLRAAFSRAADNGDHDSALAIADALWDFGFMGLNYEVFDWAETAARMAPPDHPLLASVAGIVSLGAWARDDGAKGAEFAEMALAAEQHSGVGHTLPVRLAILNSAVYAETRHPIDRVFDELVEASTATGEPYWIANTMVLSSLAQSMAGVTDEARGSAAGALRLARKADNASSIAWSLFALGTAAEQLDHDYAASCLTEAITVARGVDNRWVMAMAQSSLASTRRRSGDTADAATQLCELLDLWMRVGHKSHAWHAIRLGALVLGEAGDTDAMLLLDRAATAADFVMPLLNDERHDLVDRIAAALDAAGPEEAERLELRALLMDLPDAVAFAARRLESLV